MFYVSRRVENLKCGVGNVSIMIFGGAGARSFLVNHNGCISEICIEYVECLLQLVGDFQQLQEVTNMVVLNKIQMQEVLVRDV